MLHQNVRSVIFKKELIDEFIIVALRPKFKRYFSTADLQALLLSMNDRTIFIEVSSTVKICRDEKDNFLLALAKDAKASHLLTGDKDLLVLKNFGKTKILTITEYLT